MSEQYPNQSERDPSVLNPPNFVVVRKGFDQTQVMGYLRSVERSMQTLVQEKTRLSEHVQQLQERIENPDLDIEKITEIFGRQASEILRGAHDAAEAIRQRADAVSKETIARAAREGAEIVSRANLDAEAQLDEAAGSSQEILETARSQAHDTIVVAEQGAASILDRAKVEGRAVILRARELRSKIFEETQARIDELQLEIQGLEDSRTVLIQLIRSARRMLDEMAEVLEHSTAGLDGSYPDEAPNAALSAVVEEPLAENDPSRGSSGTLGRLLVDSVESTHMATAETGEVESTHLATSEPSEEVSSQSLESEETQLTNEIDMLAQGSTDPIETFESVEAELAMVAEPQQPDFANDAAVEELTGPVVVMATEAAPEDAFVEMEPQEAKSSGDVDAEVGGSLGEVSRVGGALQSFLSGRAAQRISTSTNANESLQEAQVWPDAPGVVHDSEDSGPDIPDPLAQSDRRLHRLEDLFGRLKVTQSATIEGVDDRVPASEMDLGQISGSGESSDGPTGREQAASERFPTAGLEFTAAAFAGELGVVDDEIQRSTDWVHPTRDAGEGESVETEGERERVAAQSDSELLGARDVLVGPIATSLGRRIKRMLQDDQNDLLDALRQGGIGKVLERAAELSDDRDRRVPQIFELLHKSEREGRNFAEALRGESAATADRSADNSSEEDLRIMTDQSLGVVVSLTLGRVASMSSSLERANEAGQVSILGSIFRDIRGQKVDELVGDLVGSAFALGVRSIGGALGYRWLTSDLGVNCADCDDNALANVNPSEEEFPTGHRLPPVHGGCRCLIVPVFA